MWCGGPTQKLIKMDANFCRRNGTALPSLQTRFDYHTLVMFYKIHTNQAPSYLTSLLPPLSIQDQDTHLENFLTVSPLYQKPQLSTVSYLEQLLCGMPYLLMFNKQAQSMLLRSLSNLILKYKPSPSFFVFFFVLLFLIFFFIYFPLSSFSACYAPYFSSTGTQPDKYWFTFSTILFKYMSLKSEV